MTADGYVISGNEELETAVSEWCSDEAAAEANYGHISTWNTGAVTSMAHLVYLYCSTKDGLYCSTEAISVHVGNGYIRCSVG